VFASKRENKVIFDVETSILPLYVSHVLSSSSHLFNPFVEVRHFFLFELRCSNRFAKFFVL